MLLYNSTPSGNCYKVRLLLHHLGLPFEREEVAVVGRDWNQRRELLGDKSPALRVPVLVLDDGTALAESNAIIWYLAEGTEYLPDDRLGRARALQWMFFEQYSHEPFIAVARFWQTILGEEERYATELVEKRAGGYAALDAMERHLADSPFFAGDRYSIADIALYAYTHVADEGGFDLEPYPAIRGWLARVAEQPGHVPIMA